MSEEFKSVAWMIIRIGASLAPLSFFVLAWMNFRDARKGRGFFRKSTQQEKELFNQVSNSWFSQQAKTGALGVVEPLSTSKPKEWLVDRKDLGKWA